MYMKNTWIDGHTAPLKNRKELMIDVGVAVVEARIIGGLTQKQLADRLGTKQSAVSMMETGARLPSFDMLLRIAKATKTDLNPPFFSKKSP